MRPLSSCLAQNHLYFTDPTCGTNQALASAPFSNCLSVGPVVVGKAGWMEACMADWMGGWLAVCLDGWLAGLLAGKLLAGWLDGWLAEWLAGWPDG